MRNLILLSLAAFLLITANCSKKGNDPGGGDPNDNAIEKIEALGETQAELSTQLESLLMELDSTAAIDSIAKLVRSDAENVTRATTGEQGIAIEYKNGLRGVIVLNTKDLGGSAPEPAKSLYEKSLGKSSSGTSWKPASKKTKFLNPSHWERSQFADPLLAKADIYFDEVGFDHFERRFDAAADLNEFTSLSGYGIVHIYSHGWAWPNDANISEVYVLTGEVVSQQANTQYLWDLQHGKIMIGSHHGQNRYWISPSFFAAHNDLHADTSLVYLGFCYSRNGNWQDTLMQVAGAAATVGFDWHVFTGWNAVWAEHLYYHMCDTSYAYAMNLSTWRDADPCLDNTYFDSEAECQKWVSVWDDGHGDLVLWSAFKIFSLTPTSGAGDTQVEIRGIGFGHPRGANSTATLGGVELTVDPWDWSDTLIVARIPIDAVSGDVVVTVNGVNSNALYFTVQSPSHVLRGTHARHKYNLYSPNSSESPFEITIDLTFGGTVTGPGLVTLQDTTIWPYPDTEPLNAVHNYHGSVGGPSPAQVTVAYTMQTMVNDQDANSHTAISLTKNYPNGNWWEVTVTPAYLIEYWNNDEHPYWEETEILPQYRNVAINNADHLIIARRLYIHAVYHTSTGYEEVDDWYPSWNIAGFTLFHR